MFDLTPPARVAGWLFAAVLILAGCAFGVQTGNWVAPIVGVLGLAATCVPAKDPTIPSTWAAR